MLHSYILFQFFKIWPRQIIYPLTSEVFCHDCLPIKYWINTGIYSEFLNSLWIFLSFFMDKTNPLYQYILEKNMIFSHQFKLVSPIYMFSNSNIWFIHASDLQDLHNIITPTSTLYWFILSSPKKLSILPWYP